MTYDLMEKESRNDPILQEDLCAAAEDKKLCENFFGKTIVVTGATGLVGSILLRTLACINRLLEGNMHLFGVVRNEEKARAVYGEAFLAREDISLLQGDILESAFALKVKKQLEYVGTDSVDLVIHCAAVTASRTMVEKPVETIMTAIGGTRNVLDFARDAFASSFVYISSMEVYGTLPQGVRASEEQLGYLDIRNIRSNYPESKRMCENLCIGYGAEYGLDIKIARLAQTFGAGILPWESRVFAQFAKSAIEGKNIVLHTQGLSEGNYCYTADAARGILTIAARGERGEIYNVVNENTHTTIRDMAQMVACNIAKGSIRVVFDIPEENTFGYAADAHLIMDASRLKRLGWEPRVDLEEMYVRMIGSMRSQGI